MATKIIPNDIPKLYKRPIFKEILILNFIDMIMIFYTFFLSM